MERIEPIRRDDGARSIDAVKPIARRDGERDRDQQPRRRRTPEPDPAVTRDDDGTPHVDIRA
jgi:hypothetical protein